MMQDDIDLVLTFEGGYSNDPDDLGGATNKGITQETYDRYKDTWKLPHQDVKLITDSEVNTIYADYYTTCKADQVAGINPRLATLLFDYSINSGPSQAIKSLQKVVGTPQDGSLGPLTLEAIRIQSNIAYSIAMIRLCQAYALERILFLTRLCLRKTSQSKFLLSWLSRVETIMSK